jgi:hypothetical protein
MLQAAARGFGEREGHDERLQDSPLEKKEKEQELTWIC